MNVRDQSLVLRTAEDFLAWNEGREGRREFARGRVTEMMVNVSLAHWKLSTRLNAFAGAHLDDLQYDFGTSDFGVRTAASVRYPDFLVIKSGGGMKDLATCVPLLIAEILSPSSLALDFGEKAMEYTAIASLLHYLVLSQDEPRVWLWTRGEAGFAAPQMIVGPAESIGLPGLGITLSLADLYRGIA